MRWPAAALPFDSWLGSAAAPSRRSPPHRLPPPPRPPYKAAVTRITPLLELPAAQSAAKLAAPYVTAVTTHLAPVAA